MSAWKPRGDQMYKVGGPFVGRHVAYSISHTFRCRLHGAFDFEELRRLGHLHQVG
jgi:hypothetical protein